MSYVNTAGARQAIRIWFRKQERAENMQRGQDLIEKERKRLALDFTVDEIADKAEFYHTGRPVRGYRIGRDQHPPDNDTVSGHREASAFLWSDYGDRHGFRCGVTVMGVGDVTPVSRGAASPCRATKSWGSSRGPKGKRSSEVLSQHN